MSKGITDEQRATLRSLAPALAPETYLAGGVAISVALGHRYSRDLDLFLQGDFDPERVAERLVASVSGLVITNTAPGTLYMEIHGIPTSLLSYRYPLLRQAELSPKLCVRVASLEDLTCMKLSAVSARGTARDFWDLHALLQHGVASGRLSEALELFHTKYKSEDVGHVVRSLVYFADADANPLPQGLTSQRWSELKVDFERWVRELE